MDRAGHEEHEPEVARNEWSRRIGGMTTSKLHERSFGRT